MIYSLVLQFGSMFVFCCFFHDYHYNAVARASETLANPTLRRDHRTRFPSGNWPSHHTKIRVVADLAQGPPLFWVV